MTSWLQRSLLCASAAWAAPLTSCDRNAVSPEPVLPEREARKSDSSRGLDNPEAFVRSVYASYSAGKVVGLPREALSPDLHRMLERDEAEAGGGVGRLEFDPWVNGQDFDLRRVELIGKAQSGDRYRVVVSFENMGERNVNRVDFEKRRGKWYLADIRNEQPGSRTEGWVLSKLLAVQASE